MKRLLAASVLILSATLAPAQETRTEAIRFAAGTSEATVRDRIVGYESVVYTLGAEAGQRMTVALDADNRATYFNVYAPGSAPGDAALARSGLTGETVPDLNRFDAVIAVSGTYSVSVYMMRAAARRNEASSYSIVFGIAGDMAEQVRGDFADGLQGGPDHLAVKVSPGSRLNLRAAPSAAGRIVARLRDGTVMRNLGCRMAEARRWCRVTSVDGAGLEGWAAGDFLIEGAGPASSSAGDG